MRVFIASEFHLVLCTTLLFDFLMSECNSVLLNATCTTTSLKMFVTPRYAGQVIYNILPLLLSFFDNSIMHAYYVSSVVDVINIL